MKFLPARLKDENWRIFPPNFCHTFLSVPQKEAGKRSSITFFRFRDSFGHFLVTFSEASVTFFCHFFAKLLLPDSFCSRVIFADLGEKFRQSVSFSALSRIALRTLENLRIG